MTDQGSRELNVVRVKLGADREAPQPDPLGRARVGYLQGVPAPDLWERGRGTWRARLEKVAEAQLLLIAFGGTVVMVGAVDGVTFHDGRVAVTGFPDPNHPLIGQPDPLDNASANPVAYGTLQTIPARQADQREYTEVLADAIAVLTEAVRMRRPGMKQDESGNWVRDTERTEQSDWAEFVTLALAGAAANAGGISAALAGRPGSWEAAGVQSLLESTVGPEETDLWSHRTEPLRIVVDVDELVSDRTDAYSHYDAAARELWARDEAQAEADPEPDYDEFFWSYPVDAAGEPGVSDQAGAPAWSWETWRAYLASLGHSPSDIERTEAQVRAGADARMAFSLSIPKSAAAAAEWTRLTDERDARLTDYTALEEQLEAQRLREWAAYGDALAAQIRADAAKLEGLTVPVEVTVSIDSEQSQPSEYDWGSIELRLVNAAVEAVPSPAELPGTPLERLGV